MSFYSHLYPYSFEKSWTLLFVSILLVGCGTSRKQVSHRQESHRSTSSISAHAVVDDAYRLRNSPYRFGGESPRGFDCSGFVKYVFDQNGIQLPRRSVDQAQYGEEIALRDVQPGDLLFFRSGGQINHVGIVSSNRGGRTRMIHASSTKGVIESDLAVEDYWRKRVAFARRM